MRRVMKIAMFLILITVAWFASNYYLNFQPYKLKAEPTPVSGNIQVVSDSWVSTWGGEDFFSGCGNCGAWYDNCNDVAIDDAGYVYVTGRTMERCYPEATGSAYLTKFDSSANVIWRHQWAGGAGMGQELEYDPEGSIIVAGTYAGEVDLDPGPDTEKFKAVEGNDLFLIKFNLDGEYQWGVSWGGHDGPDALYKDSATAIEIDSEGNIYVAGGYYGACDFDPYAGIALHTSTKVDNDDGPFPRSTNDIYLTSFTRDGKFRWVRTWPSESSWNSVTDIAVDDEDNLYITGAFLQETDFDPGTDKHIVRPVGGHDAFLLKLDSEGFYKWVRIWGGSLSDNANGVAIGTGLVYVAGDFGAETQFDPGPGTLFMTANGEKDPFLSVFDTNGVFQWVKTWGGEDSDYWGFDSARDVIITDNGRICVAGVFPETVDFTGASEEVVTAKGSLDSYVLLLDESGEFERFFSWGKDGKTCGTSLAWDNHGNLYVGGTFENGFEFISGDTFLSVGLVAPMGEYSIASSDSFLLKINIDEID